MKTIEERIIDKFNNGVPDQSGKRDTSSAWDGHTFIVKLDMIEIQHIISVLKGDHSQLSQPSDVSDEIKDIIDSILKFDFNESLVIKGEYFNTIQRDLKKAIGQIKPTIPNTDNEWIDINFLLPETGVTVLCKLSKDIGLGTTEKKLYRMKYNGKWNDYDHLVTHWKIIGKNKIKVHYAWEIKPTIEGECIHLKTQDSVCGWSVDHICNTKDCPAYNPPKVYYCTICQKNPVDAENGYDTCQDCINKV